MLYKLFYEAILAVKLFKEIFIVESRSRETCGLEEERRSLMETASKATKPKRKNTNRYVVLLVLCLCEMMFLLPMAISMSALSMIFLATSCGTSS